MTKPTVHHHLSTLHQEKYVVKEDDTYYIGLQFLELGERSRDRLKIHKVAKPEVEKLAEETGELANMAVMEHREVVYLYRVRGSEAAHLDTYTGKRTYPHSTAMGKAMLAHLPQERLEAVIAQNGLPKETERTITEKDDLFEELKEFEVVGYRSIARRSFRGFAA